MSEPSIHTTNKSGEIKTYGLMRNVEPKNKVNDHEICPLAKSGLEAKIDFRSAASVLKVKEKDSKGLVLNIARELNGEHKIRLVHVKGSRKCQFRLVKPSINSMSINDSYVIISENQLIVWHGKNTTMMKKARANEFGDNIKKYKEYNCRALKVMTFEGTKVPASISKILNEDIKEFKAIELSDKDYDDIIIKSTLLYEINVLDDETINFELNKELSGKALRQKNLCSDKAYYIDFGNEAYIWIGSKYARSTNKLENELILNKFNEINEEGLECLKEKKEILKEYGYYFGWNSRPEWATLERINEKCENILFKKKFIDWIDHDICLNPIKLDGSKEKKRNKIDIEKCLKENIMTDYIIMGAYVNRGQGGYDIETDFSYAIFKKSFDLYIVENMNFKIIDDLTMFFSEESYLIKFNFYYRRRDLKPISSDVEDNSGREIIIYYYWQGRNCTISEKAISAVLTIFHVSKSANQVHVMQDEENPDFISIFEGKYISALGKSINFENDNCHLYIIRGSVKEEVHLVEVEASIESLRSQAIMLLVCKKKNKIYKWIGKSSIKNIDINEQINNLIKLYKCNKSEFDIIEINENAEPTEFLNELNPTKNVVNVNRNLSKIKFCCSFHKIDQSNIECTRVLSNFFRIKSFDNSKIVFDDFPIIQNHLYNLFQPALVLICTNTCTYLWHGWKNPKNMDFDVNQITAEESIFKDLNFLEFKRCIIEDAISFLKDNYFSTEIVEIHAGLETHDFISLFPTWKINQDVLELQKKIGRDNITTNVITEEKLSEKKFYSIDVLRTRPLPENVNSSEIEMYLEDSEFNKLFGMTKREYSHLQKWKQIELKKKFNLF